MSSSAARAPWLGVTVDGAPVAGALAAEVLSNNFLGCDRFDVRMALSADPAMGASFWADLGQSDVTVSIGLAGPFGATELVAGRVDLVEIDPVRGLARIEGRDNAARLIETRIGKAFANQTSSDIATMLAGQAGLTPDVTQTTTPVGRYYGNDHDSVSLDWFSRATTAWDLLCFLARAEGFDLFVSGETLSFNPPIAEAPVAVDLSDCMDVRLERVATLARPVSVTVRSWSSRQGMALTETATGGSSAGATAEYVIVRPNLTSDQAQALAQRTIDELTGQTRAVTLRMPGELTIAPRAMISLGGTQSSFDDAFRVVSVRRRFDMRRGFTQTVRAVAGS